MSKYVWLSGPCSALVMCAASYQCSHDWTRTASKHNLRLSFSSFCFLAAESKLPHPVSQCSDLAQCGRKCQSAWAEASETVGQDQSFPCYIVSLRQSIKTLPSRDSTAVFKMKGRIQQENAINLELFSYTNVFLKTKFI